MADNSRSLARLRLLNLEDLGDVEDCRARWCEVVKSKLNVVDDEQLTAKAFMGPTKPVLSCWLEEARDIMDRQQVMMSDMKEVIDLLKIEALSDKEKVIRMQDKLLQCKDEQLTTLQSTVKATVESTVHSTVQKEIKSYSAAVSQKNCGPVLTPASLQKVVVKAIEEDDRSKNLLVFGLLEEEGEQIEETIGEIFAELDEKPRVTACRIGKKSPGASSVCRPVKVSLASSISARQILSKTRRLKQMERRKSVYICPDRSPEERAARKGLVSELKKITAEQPDREHFIRHGTVFSKDKIKPIT